MTNNWGIQPDLLNANDIQVALDTLATAGTEERGAIFTRLEVVDFILDLCGYTANKPLHKFRLLEPAFGHGDFLIPTVERLLRSCQGTDHMRGTSLTDAVRAVELHTASFDTTTRKLIELLKAFDFSASQATKLVSKWLVQGDYLLTDFSHDFTHVVGNPPYVRQEMIPDILMSEYRRRFGTIYDRADLYIPFIERSLQHLAPNGELGFICADRWMKNRYGGPLRQLVADKFYLKFFVDMVDTPAFHSDVIAYPAITIITREKPGPTRITHRPELSTSSLNKLCGQFHSEIINRNGPIAEIPKITANTEPWILGSFNQLAVVRRLEKDFPAIEDTGCKVGIGVATGADQAFTGKFDELDVEPDRKLPLAKTIDIKTGHVVWQGFGIINPFHDHGPLVDLKDYPKLAAYLKKREGQIVKRHVARKNPRNWYRTIDRIYPALTYEPKLLIPDIKGDAQIVFEDGRLYPHHNLYYITSTEWDLHALQTVLLSGIARLFVSTYSTKMRGGYLRYQAQHLRRIRLPRWHLISDGVKASLSEAADTGDVHACNQAVACLYGLTAAERRAIGENGN